jgi:transcriptional regulator with XRE-family HTH domain
MKRNAEIRIMFGLTQNEMARLLGIGPSLWSMYELGQRTLPVHAFEKLAELFRHAEAAKMAKPVKRGEANTLGEHAGYLLRENEYRRIRAARKIEAAQTRLAIQQRRQFLIGSLAQGSAGSKIGQPNFLAAKRVAVPEAAREAELAKLELELELLEAEKKVLESKLDQISKRS